MKLPSDVKRHYSTNVKLTNPGGGRGTPGNSRWGCTAGFSKSWPYFRPKNVTFQTRFHTWPLKFLPCILRPGLKEIMSSLLRLEQQQKRFLKIHFEFAYFFFFLSRLKLKKQIRSYTIVVPLKTIPDSRPKRRHKIPILWGGTTYMVYWEYPPPPGILSTS